MRNGHAIAVIIPALNEGRAIAHVLDAIPEWADDVIVADNGSSDETAEIARAHGARVVFEPRRGYGSACLAAIAALSGPDVVVFLDGDFSDHPEQMDRLVDPITAGAADLVIGSRVLGVHEPGALTPQARFGNWIATRLIRHFWKVCYTDLGPFRAIRHYTLTSLSMADRGYGWTVEMQIKSAIQGARTQEVPVDYRKRVGKSKVSGTVRGVLGAGYKILGTIFVAALTRRRFPAARAKLRRLVVFTRYPHPGKTKKRLIPVLGADGAADLQREMTEFTMETVKRATRSLECSVEVRFEGGDVEMMADWLGAGVSYMPQGPGDLGERMTRAMTEAFDAGAGEVVIIGSDCPLLSGDTLREAFQALGRSDMVIGPASDGGYYLVGLHSSARYRALPHVFFGPAWGTETVRSTTLSLAEQRQLSVHCLAELRDVDRPEDIPLWQNIREKCRKRRESPRISVIIPAMDEADYIGATLRAVKSACDIEILVADGGSSDATATIAEAVGARVLPYKPGRARQANAAAQLACGQVLLFLHADTRVPLGWDQIIEEAMADPGTIAGVFSFGVDIGGFSMRLFTKVANFRARWLHRPYGDQGLFLRKSTFEQLGGFPDIPIMDDLEIVRRLARLGRIVVVPTPAITSGRRWRRYGIWRTMWVNQICVIAYLLGVSPYRIARWYNRRPDRYDDYG